MREEITMKVLQFKRTEVEPKILPGDLMSMFELAVEEQVNNRINGTTEVSCYNDFAELLNYLVDTYTDGVYNAELRD